MALIQMSENKASRGVVAVKHAVLSGVVELQALQWGSGFFLILMVSSWLTVVETGLKTFLEAIEGI